MKIYRFYLTIGSTETEVFPLNFLETLLVDELGKGQIFYRRVFSGTLTFYNCKDFADFDLLYAAKVADPCQKILFRVERINSGVWETYWEGYFSTTHGEFDLDNCTFTVNPLADDDYVDILDKADLQYNILDAGSAVTTRAIQGLIDVTYTRNRWLTDVIDYLASDATVGIIPGCTISYDFFTDTPDNYVTQHDNHLTLLTIAQKSDIIRPTSSNPATSAMMSWNELMDILWAMFQVKWDYDPGTNTINVEHVSWWTRGAGLDLRTQEMTRATNKYNYLNEQMPKYEKFAFAEADDANFVGLPIWYDSKCVNQDPGTNVQDIAINVTTDLTYIIDNQNTDVIDDGGFVILCNYEDGGDYFVEIEPGRHPIEEHIRLNMHLSWCNLHHRYFRYERVLIEGYMNNSLETFWTAKKVIHQQCFAIICPDDAYDSSDEITTELGETWLGGAKAVVQQSSLKPSGEMKFDLLYGPADNTPAEIEDQKWALIWEDENVCGKFHIHLTESYGSDMDIDLWWEIYDDTDLHVANLVCTTFGSPETWTIVSPDTEDDNTFTAVGCDPATDIPAGGCIIYYWDYSDLTAAGYIVDVIEECSDCVL